MQEGEALPATEEQKGKALKPQEEIIQLGGRRTCFLLLALLVFETSLTFKKGYINNPGNQKRAA